MNDEKPLKDLIFRTFLSHSNFGPKEMADHLQVNYNSVKAIYSKLSEEGLLERTSRGSYSPNMTGILLHLIDRIETLEKRVQGAS
jgi:Mn-dependent DtxR family transcriptional regulator